jgi:hypothetical protein
MFPRMRKIFLHLSVVLLALAAAPDSFAAGLKSADELRAAAEAALQSRDTGAFRALFNRQGVSAQANNFEAHILGNLARFFNAHGTNEIRVTTRLLPVPEDMEMENTINGTHFHPNMTPLGLINCHVAGPLNGTNDSWGVTMPYGQANGQFGFVGTLAEKVYEPRQKENLYSLAIDAGMAGTEAGFSVVCIYDKNGAAVTNRYHGHRASRKVVSGDALKSCTVETDAGGPAVVTLSLFKAAWDGAAYTNTLIFSGHTTATNNVIRYP